MPISYVRNLDHTGWFVGHWPTTLNRSGHQLLFFMLKGSSLTAWDRAFKVGWATLRSEISKHKILLPTASKRQLCPFLMFKILIIQADLLVIDQLRRTDLASRFYFLRYEDAALQPEVELSKLVESLSDQKSSNAKYFCPPSLNDSDQVPYNSQSFEKYPGNLLIFNV